MTEKELKELILSNTNKEDIDHLQLDYEDFMAILKKADPNSNVVVYDFVNDRIGSLEPSIDTYRGDYSQSALPFRAENYSTAEEINIVLTENFGTELWGYKGGQYIQRESTELNLADPGRWSQIILCTAFILEIEDTDEEIVAVIAIEEEDY